MRLTAETWTLLNQIKVIPHAALNSIMEPERVDLSKIFLDLHKMLPNTFRLLGVDHQKVFNWMLTQHLDLVNDYTLKGTAAPTRGFQSTKSVILYLKPDLMMGFSEQGIDIAYKNTSQNFIQQLMDETKGFKRRTTYKFKPQLNLISHNNYLNTITVDLKVPSIAVKDSYNDDFLPIDTKIKTWLKSTDNSGLLLLHGKPGTGKTSYLRHLMGKCKVNFIYIPASMGYCLALPSFTQFLTENAESVFVIEDAEKLLLDRETGQSSDVSSILNLCDGLLSDAFSIKIICTFNMASSKIDKALLRKGRLFGMYEFKALTADKCNLISEKLGFTTRYNQPTVLTEVCNPEEVIFNEPDSNSVGFSLKSA